MIYLDTSVVLAQLLAEDRYPPEELWGHVLVSSRLLQYEVWTRIFARNLRKSHEAEVRDLLGRIAFVELSTLALARGLEAFPRPVRTLDAMHLSTLEFLRGQSQLVELASYDDRMLDVAKRMKIPICSIVAS
jgi:hypothetical protein